MLALIDIGNTTIAIGLSLDELTLFKVVRLNTEKNKSTDEYAITLDGFLKDITAVVISSVVPELNDVFREYFQSRYKITPLFLGAGVKTGIKINADNPKEVGSDLITNAVAATAFYGKSALVIDLGTATTFTYIDQLTIKGVIIAAGLTTQKNALISKTSLLPQVELETPTKLLGTNSADCIKSGLVYGHASMIDGMIRRIKRTLERYDLPVVLTGGHARIIAPLLEEPVLIDDTLILKGLFVIYDRNRDRFKN
jgi:type III pantothenate kinase